MFTDDHATALTKSNPGSGFRFRNILHFLARGGAARLQRLQLARLDDAALRDIGLTRKRAAQEASRPFWDAPSHWHR